LSQPIDWTGVQEITERSRKTPGHPMCQDDAMEIVRKIESRLNDWRSGNDGEPTGPQLLAALEALK